MPTLRDELIPVIDEARGVLDELGLRVRRVEHVVRSWSGAEVGAGEVTEEVAELSPAPRVRQVTRWQAGQAGELEEGDLRVDQVSASYERAWLEGDDLTAAQELVYRIDGEDHRLVSAEVKSFEWRLIVRRVRR